MAELRALAPPNGAVRRLVGASATPPDEPHVAALAIDHEPPAGPPDVQVRAIAGYDDFLVGLEVMLEAALWPDAAREWLRCEAHGLRRRAAALPPLQSRVRSTMEPTARNQRHTIPEELRRYAEDPAARAPAPEAGSGWERVLTERYCLMLGPTPSLTMASRLRLDPDEIAETLAEVRSVVAARGVG